MTSPAIDTASLRALEEAALRAWPAAQQLLYDGWVARLSDGYTKRANSATLLYPQPDSDHFATIERLENLYRSHGRPVIFRLVSFSTPPDLAPWLADRGYREADGTLVMTCPLEGDLPLDSAVNGLDIDLSIALHARMNGMSSELIPGHRRILERIPAGLTFSGLEIDHEIVACGLSVTEGQLAGLYDIVTDPNHRRKGFGLRLVRGMMAEASARGVTTAYLQVVATNVPAISLYQSLGFTEAYRYAYRILD